LRRTGRSSRRRPLTWLLAAALVAAAGVAAGASARTAHPCVRTGELRLEAADGTRIAAHRFGRGTSAVVLAHGSRGWVCHWEPYARGLAALGYLVVAFDFRGNGDSERRPYPASTRLAGDFAAAVKAVRRLGAAKVAIVGSSMGGAVAVVAGANIRPPVDAVAAARRLQVPVLYVAAEEDTYFADEARILYEATASPEKTLRNFGGGGHGIALVDSPSESRTLVEAFIRSHTS
jgi:pimeloyl-ACP methyl ester carboxylesterase